MFICFFYAPLKSLRWLQLLISVVHGIMCHKALREMGLRHAMANKGYRNLLALILWPMYVFFQRALTLLSLFLQLSFSMQIKFFFPIHLFFF